MNHLFIFTLSPVQSFITAARKTHDMYAGSRILSELTRVAALRAKELGIELIFPVHVTQGSPLPNRFIGKINSKTDSQLQETGRSISESLQEYFTKIAKTTLEAINVTPDNQFWKQIAVFWEINWVFYPISGDGDSAYREAYNAIEKELNAVKNLRTLVQNPEQGRKCSLDGERNALFFGPETNQRYYNKPEQIIKTGLWLASNEGLSAISIIKRGFEKGEGKSGSAFASTAEIALLHEIEANNALFVLYKDFIKSDEFDYQFCYKENINEKYFRKNGYTSILDRISPLNLEICRQQLFGSRELPKHYALVAFDGDQMGNIMSGVKDIFKGDDLEVFQRTVSKQLIAFAEESHRQFNSHPSWGRIVYTGGDDFLGFINLQYLFPAVRQLRQDFQRIVNRPIKENDYFSEGFNFTFSAGIAMAHYKTPLSIVINKAKSLEQKAKDMGRDSFAIAAIKHSGESHEAFYKWELSDDLLHWKALEQLTDYLERQICSENFARVLTRSFYVLQDQNGKILNSALIKAEIKRTIQRAMSPQHKGKADLVIECVERLLLSPGNQAGNEVSFINFSEMLNIALFLKRVRKNKIKNNGNQI